MGRIVTISYTELNAGGGVPKFNRDLHAAFPDRECAHFCWWDHPFHPELDEQGLTPEWAKARLLNEYLISRRLVRSDDVIIADGFWADGLQSMPFAVSHSHGIWSHLTKEDVDAGKQPDMPYHHAAQVSFRKRWVELGKPLTAVSDFIADQLKQQWGWDAHVINNGVDTDVYRPATKIPDVKRPLVIHGVNDRGNANKGWDHIEWIIDHHPEWNVLSLDEACGSLSLPKNEALAQADLVVHPSGYEGNSMFIAEVLACDVPVVGYDVGFLWKVRGKFEGAAIGRVISRSRREPSVTEQNALSLLQEIRLGSNFDPRSIALEHLSISRFRENWRAYVEDMERT